MTELSFAKSFLTTLDSKPSKISADHVEDPKNYPPRGALILPKMPRPLEKKRKLAPGEERSVSVILKSPRNPPLSITLAAQPLSTSILALKETLSAQTSIPLSKIRILHSKKPVADSKILKDVVGDEDGASKVEFGVMVIGGAAVLKRPVEEEVEPRVAGPSAVAGGVSGKEALSTEEFWADLRGFLVQRLRDENEGERLHGLFRKAVDAES